MAGLLARLGVRKGDRVAGLLEKSPEGIMLYLAVARAGAVYMPLAPALREPELDYLLRDATPRVAICRAGARGHARTARRRRRDRADT